ncbi:hypothetical protein E4T56_gene14634 [Termitomyces sp. T112]|nr:hypothetical protein E4T56_gene14634 [Termitomyces sp. T112]
MSSTTRASSRPPPSGANTTGTPKRTRLIPTHSDLKTLLASDPSPVRALPDACKWLETNGWILTAEPYDHAKLVSILATAALSSKQAEMRNTMLVAAFLLKANIADNVASDLADRIASKTLGSLSGLIEKLSSTAKFLAANNAQRAESTLALKSTTETLAGATTSLDAMASKLASTPMQPNATPTWATIAKAAAPNPPLFAPGQQPSVHNLSADDRVRVQQCVLQDARTVLIQFNLHDNNAPKDHTAEGSPKLWDTLNKILGELDKKAMAVEEGEAGKVKIVTPKTRAIGLKTISHNSAVTRLSTRNFSTTSSAPTAISSTSPTTSSQGLSPVQAPLNRTTTSLWLKNPDLRSPKQTVASLKISCNDPTTANDMIRGLTARSMAIIEAIVKRRDAAPGVQATVALPLPARQSSTAFVSRCEEFNKWFPKNHMPYFPTEDHTTWATAPPKRPTPPLGTCPPAQPIPTTRVSASKADHPPQPA